MSDAGELREKPGAWVDLGLTLPIFVAYHAGVIFLHVQNATDPITGPLLRVSEGNRAVYLLITASIGVVFAAVFGIVGRGEAFRPQKFVQIALEGVLYAVLMRLGAAYVVGHLFAAVGREDRRRRSRSKGRSRSSSCRSARGSTKSSPFGCSSSAW